MSSRVRTFLAVGMGVVVVVIVVAVIVRSMGWYGQSDSDRYRPTAEALRRMRPSMPGNFTPYGQPPKPGEIRPVPVISGEKE